MVGVLRNFVVAGVVIDGGVRSVGVVVAGKVSASVLGGLRAVDVAEGVEIVPAARTWLGDGDVRHASIAFVYYE